jgi:hypothetical protein
VSASQQGWFAQQGHKVTSESESNVSQDSSLLGCNALPTGKYLPEFRSHFIRNV